MHRLGSDVRDMMIGGLVLFALIAVVALFVLSSVTGLPLMSLVDNARPLLIGPGLYLVVWGIERFEVPLPLRFENTWPFILGAFWIGIHTLIVLKFESENTFKAIGESALAYTNDFYDLPELPWYADSFFCCVVFAVIVGGGYWARYKRNRYY